MALNCQLKFSLLQVEEITQLAKERVDLAKALVRASEKPAKSNKDKDKDKASPTGAGGEANGAAEATTA